MKSCVELWVVNIFLQNVGMLQLQSFWNHILEFIESIERQCQTKKRETKIDVEVFEKIYWPFEQ